MKKISLLLLCVLMLSLCACGKTSVIVEEFVGHNVQDVYNWCGQLDEDHECEITYEDVDGYEKDIVVEQSIQAGKKLKDTIKFTVASGNEKEIALPYVTEDVTVADIEAWRDAAGIKDLKFVYVTSDTVEKNHIIRIDPYVNVHKDTPITVTVSSGKAEPTSTTIEIKLGDYIGLTVEEFESKAKALGLNPNHQTTRDRYNPDIKFGNIAWHGSGTYEKGETFNYGVCINAITVSPGQYYGITEADFIKAAKALKLTPTHIDSRDGYSSKVAKGSIYTHGNGVYVEGEQFKYGLSKGPAKVESGYEGAIEENFVSYLEMLELKGDRKTSNSSSVSAGRIISYNYGNYSSGDAVTYVVSIGPESTSVNVPDFSGRSENEFLSFLSSNGLYAGSRTETTTSSYSRGTIVYNDNGNMAKGSRVNYTVAGNNVETAIVESFDTIYQQVTHEGDYEHAAYDMHRYLFGRGFNNYDIVPVAYKDYEPGILLAIYVNDHQLDYPENLPLDTYFYILISSDVE